MTFFINWKIFLIVKSILINASIFFWYCVCIWFGNKLLIMKLKFFTTFCRIITCLKFFETHRKIFKLIVKFIKIIRIIVIVILTSCFQTNLTFFLFFYHLSIKFNLFVIFIIIIFFIYVYIVTILLIVIL